MPTSETRRKTFKEIEKEEGTDAAIEAGILCDPDANNPTKVRPPSPKVLPFAMSVKVTISDCAVAA